MPDSGYLQEEEAAYANRRGFSKHKPALPLYTAEDAKRSLSQLRPVPFERETTLLGDVTLRLRPAGHLLGASLVELRHEGKTVLFSGDLGRPNDPIMVAPESVARADYLLVESTYGDRRHDESDPKQQLMEVVNRTAERGGTIIVPSFAIGRAQLLLHLIHVLKGERAIPDVPVFLNSPMAISATQLYHKFRSEHRLTPEECDGLHTSRRW